MPAQSMHAYVVAGLQNAKGRWRLIAEATGIPKRTVEKIASGEIADPGVMSVQKLADYFRGPKKPRGRSR